MRKGPIGGAIQQPSALWYGMVAAYAPMSIRGFIWYQGCHNAGEYQRYANKMHALYNGWAKEFQNPGLKLYFVQLAPWGNPGIANIQEAQAQFDREEKNAGMAVINDVGNLADIHPNDKRTVAKRLALHALKRDYGYSWLNDNSPTLKSWKVEGDKFVLTFNDAKGWYVYNPDRSVQTGFEVCGEDGKWVKATIENLAWGKGRDGKPKCDGNIKGTDLIVKADGVAAPKKLRYMYSAPWFGCLYNEMNLPLGAFHIGD
jgi:sialate O-acetylesterase